MAEQDEGGDPLSGDDDHDYNDDDDDDDDDDDNYDDDDDDEQGPSEQRVQHLGQGPGHARPGVHR